MPLNIGGEAEVRTFMVNGLDVERDGDLLHQRASVGFQLRNGGKKALLSKEEGFWMKTFVFEKFPSNSSLLSLKFRPCIIIFLFLLFLPLFLLFFYYYSILLVNSYYYSYLLSILYSYSCLIIITLPNLNPLAKMP